MLFGHGHGLGFIKKEPAANYAASGDPINLTSFVSVPTDDNVWTSPDNAQNQDDSYTGSFISPASNTDQLECTNLLQKIPPSATITGIKVELDKYSSAAGVATDLIVRLIKAGTPTGDNKADTVTFWGSLDTDTYTLYGVGITDLWSAGLNAGDINAVDFGVLLHFTSTTAFGTLFLDHIQVRIYYT